ncbi:MAG: tRNA and rRNA cytosine-C5-methylase-like protein [Ramlibacter sp.]|nr:tRNA and rRNA cytosine-C5-methylase-like protein [Ramlibacter sp.]
MHPNAILESCAELVGQVLKFDHPTDAVVQRYFRENRSLGPRERATLAETAYAVVRRKLLYEHLARPGSGPRERRLAILGFAGPRDFLLGALTEQEKEWLQACDAMPPSELQDRHRHNLPEWLVPPLQEQLGEEFWPLVESLDEPAPLDLRVNALTDKREDVRQELKLAGIATRLTPYSPWGLRVEGKPALTKLDAFARGAIEIQDEGSQLLALITDARRGQMVVDFCAGAGGKTLALGAAMRNTGRLYAFDTSAHRLDNLKPRLARSKLSNVHPAAIAHERDDRIKRLAGKIDRVIVDAPCSGLGTLRRNPGLKWRQSQQGIAELAARQTAILESAARLLKPGGRIVYATCSMLREENEAIAEAFSAGHGQFRPVPVLELLNQAKVADAASLCSGEAGQYLRLWPHRHGTDGFFAAIWEKVQ